MMGTLLFKCQYMMLGDKKPQFMDYVCESIAELHQCLAQDKITVKTVDHLYVHQVSQNGSIQEVICYDSAARSTGGVPPADCAPSCSVGGDSNVVSIQERRDRRLAQAVVQKLVDKQEAATKPHVPAGAKMRYSYLYAAEEY